MRRTTTAIAAVCTANVVLSLTRAGMLTLALVFGVLIAVGTRGAWRRLLVRNKAANGASENQQRPANPLLVARVVLAAVFQRRRSSSPK